MALDTARATSALLGESSGEIGPAASQSRRDAETEPTQDGDGDNESEHQGVRSQVERAGSGHPLERPTSPVQKEHSAQRA